MPQYSSATPSYTPNPFAGGPTVGDKQGAYASALRAYTPNQFAGSAQQPMQMAPHLSQAPPIDPDLMAGYARLRSDPRAQQYNQSAPDVANLWRQSPTSPFF